MSKVLDCIGGRPRWQISSLCVVITALVAALDYTTGEASLVIFYIIPIFLAVWTFGRKAGVFTALVCGAMSVIDNVLMAGSKAPSFAVRVWDSLMDVLMLILVCYILALLKNELEQSDERARLLAASNEALQSYNRMVSHDLRQPLNIISASCQTVEMVCGDGLSDECTRYLHIARDNVMRMNDRIEALLKFSRLAQGHLERETVDLGEMAGDVVANLRVSEPDRKVIFQVADTVTAKGDRSLLRAVLENLIGNAWKYSEIREEAIIEVGVTEIGGERAYFVRDNGKGFDMADADKLFRPFARLPGAEGAQGFGVGLSTVEQIIRRHGGRLWAVGAPDKGATFYFTLPSTKEKGGKTVAETE